MAGRNTQGVRLIRLDEKDRIAAIAIVRSEDDKEVEDTPVPAAPEPAPATPAPASPPPVKKKDNTSQATLFEKKEKKGRKKVAKKRGK
jgi:hypothetical protein